MYQGKDLDFIAMVLLLLVESVNLVVLNAALCIGAYSLVKCIFCSSYVSYVFCSSYVSYVDRSQRVM